jgi:SCY1-like protein 1
MPSYMLVPTRFLPEGQPAHLLPRKNYGSLVPDANRYAPPELARGGWGAIKAGPHTAVDSFGFGTLIFEVFNGDFSSPDQAGQTQSIPPAMHASYKRLVNATPKARITISAFLDQGRHSSSFFNTPLINLTEGVENLGVKSPEERDQFLRLEMPCPHRIPSRL